MALDRYQHLIGIPYELRNGPNVIAEDKLLRGIGINCQALFHAVYALNGKILPFAMRSKELFEDAECFESIAQGCLQLRELDTMLFGNKRWTNPRKLHIAVHIGEQDKEGQPLLIHATKVENQVTVWPLTQFSLYPQYQRIYAVKRLRASSL